MPDQYRIGAPYPLTSAAYAREFNEVKTIGGKTSIRTPEQAEIATFVSANPFPMINRGLREIAAKRHLSTSQQARLFVMTSMSTADAGIACLREQGPLALLAPTDGDPAGGL